MGYGYDLLSAERSPYSPAGICHACGETIHYGCFNCGGPVNHGYQLCYKCGFEGGPEWAFQKSVIAIADAGGWISYHGEPGGGTSAGWPDLILIRPPEWLAVELKAKGGTLRPLQRAWLEVLEGLGAETHVWFPKDLETIKIRLASEETRP